MSPWLEACQRVAHEAALAEARDRAGWAADDPRVPPFVYRWEHVRQVARNARWLLGQVAADDEVLLAASWLHDARKQERQHAARGAEFARDFLPTTDFPAHKIEAVAGAIAQHEGLWRAAEGWQESEPFRPAPPLQPIEAALLWDADKLSKMGPISLLHVLPYEVGQHARKQTTLTTETLLQRNRRWMDTMAPRLLASFNTLAAQRRGLRLYAALELFWLTAEEELGDPSPDGQAGSSTTST